MNAYAGPSMVRSGVRTGWHLAMLASALGSLVSCNGSVTSSAPGAAREGGAGAPHSFDASDTRTPDASDTPAPASAHDPLDAAADGAFGPAPLLPLPPREPGTGVTPAECRGRLAPWKRPANVWSVVTTGGRGGRDGFTGIRLETADRLTGSGTVYMYDADATPWAAVGHVDLSEELGLTEAAVAGGTTAALVGCYYKYPCGTALVIEGRQPINVTRTFYLSPARAAVAGDGTLAVAVQGLSGPRSAQFSLQRRSALGELLREVPLASVEMVVRSLLFDSQGRLLALLDEPGSQAVARFDAGSVEEARYTVPEGVSINGLALDASGNVVLVGAVAGDAGAGTLVLEVLRPDLSLLWELSTTGAGIPLAVTVTASGDLLVAGSAGSQSIWLDRYDHSGRPSWPAPLFAPTTELYGPSRVSVREQTDGSILVATGEEGFVLCP